MLSWSWFPIVWNGKYIFHHTCVEQWSLKERKQIKWVLWSLSVITRESFQTRTQGGERGWAQQCTWVEEMDLGIWEHQGKEFTGQSKGEERVAVRESSEDLQDQPPLHWVFIWVSELSREEATWSQGTNNLKEAGRKISRLKWNRNYWCSHQPE